MDMGHTEKPGKPNEDQSHPEKSLITSVVEEPVSALPTSSLLVGARICGESLGNGVPTKSSDALVMSGETEASHPKVASSVEAAAVSSGPKPSHNCKTCYGRGSMLWTTGHKPHKPQLTTCNCVLAKRVRAAQGSSFAPLERWHSVRPSRTANELGLFGEMVSYYPFLLRHSE